MTPVFPRAAVKKLVLCAILGTAVATVAHAAQPPDTLSLDGAALQSLHAHLPKDTRAFLRREADKRLTLPLVAVTDKTNLPPSGNLHDYLSYAPYFWPNPATSNGLPYVNRDGEKNPTTRTMDDARLSPMIATVQRLSLAWYFVGDNRYADRAARQLRRWFLDDTTRMTPGLDYAQGVMGKSTGRPTGIIDLHNIGAVLDAEVLLRGSIAWPDSDHKRLQAWFRDYLAWLTTSTYGKAEADMANNHGTWYDVQAAMIALFIGETNMARGILEKAKTQRIATQIEPDGSQPLELKRTKAFDYSQFNLEAFFRLARLGECAGVDLWHYRTKDGRGIRAALDWLLPFAADGKKWSHQQIKPPNYQSFAGILRRAAIAYRAPAYEAAISRMPGLGSGITWENILYPCMDGANTTATK